MIRLITAFLVFCAIPPVNADVPAATIWDILRSGDVTVMERTLADLHHAALTDPAALQNERNLYTRFMVGNPRVDGFTLRWLEADPGSAYALTARAMFLRSRAFEIRGSEYTSRTYPAALDRFYADVSEAQSLALLAYEATPDLIPASDLLLDLQRATQRLSPEALDAFVQDIMTRTPNQGSLSYALTAVEPKWGGEGLPAVYRFCADYAPLIPDPDFDVDLCVQQAVVFNDFDRDLRQAALANWIANTGPEFDRYRLPNFGDPPSEEGRQRLRHFLLTQGDREFDLLALYVRTYYTSASHPPDPEFDAYFDQQLTRLLNALKEQPNNRGTIGLLIELGRDETGQPMHYGSPEAKALWARMLVTAPYDAESWLRLVGQNLSDRSVSNLRQEADYIANAIAYSNHAPKYLAEFNARRLGQYRSHVADRNGQNDYSEAELAELFYCPIIRTRRLVQAVCANDPRDYFCGQGKPADPIEDVIDAARNAGVCEQDLLWPIDALAYDPVGTE